MNWTLIKQYTRSISPQAKTENKQKIYEHTIFIEQQMQQQRTKSRIHTNTQKSKSNPQFMSKSQLVQQLKNSQQVYDSVCSKAKSLLIDEMNSLKVMNKIHNDNEKLQKTIREQMKKMEFE